MEIKHTDVRVEVAKLVFGQFFFEVVCNHKDVPIFITILKQYFITKEKCYL